MKDTASLLPRSDAFGQMKNNGGIVQSKHYKLGVEGLELTVSVQLLKRFDSCYDDDVSQT